MGFPPPPDAPSVSDQASASVSASFEPSPTGVSLCGFTFPPIFNFSLSFRFKFPPFDFPPTFSWFLGFNCDLSNPVSGGAGFGGGRVSTIDPSPFDADL